MPKSMTGVRKEPSRLFEFLFCIFKLKEEIWFLAECTLICLHGFYLYCTVQGI